MHAASAADRRAEFRAIFDDERHFRTWYDVAARRLYRYLFGRCGGDVALTEELTQQAFLQAIRRREAYDGRADPMTWLIAIGRNALIDHVRRVEREERRHLRLLVRVLPSGEPGGDRQSRDEQQLILDVLAGLPLSQRTALVLHHVDGLSVREVAKALGRSEGAVEQLLNRGRGRFRALYEEADRG
jgi:RNA polymerase sigma-70 factor (ECF subfamily)